MPQVMNLLRRSNAVTGPLVLFVAWWVAFELQLVTPKLLPSPIGTVSSLVESFVDGSMLVDFRYMVVRTFYAFVIAVMLGVPLGIVTGATDVIPRYAWGSEAVREEWASANAPKLVAYIRAWIKGFRFLHDPGNKEAVIQLLAREAKIDEHYARGMYDLYYGPDAVPVEKDGKPDLVGYQVMLNDMVDRGMIGAPAPSPEKFVD